MKKFSKIAQGFEKNHYLCSGLGEKSRVVDALAFISRFTKMAFGLFVVGDGSQKIVGHFVLMVVEVLLLYDTRQLICCWLIIVAIANIE